jgi:ParB family chromosome partitioning protein
MADSKKLVEISLDDLKVGKGQVRTKAVQEGIDELAESIRVVGLLEPIVVCESEKKGKYEILAGQRRFLACKQLGMKMIDAVVRQRPDETRAKALSLTENLMRRDITQKEKIDACTELYKKYGTIKAVIEETGLPSREVSHYVKYDRLIPTLKKMVDEGQVDMKVALRAQDAAAAGNEKPDPAEAVKLAKEMGSMIGLQQKKLVKEREENPDAPIDAAIEAAKTGAKTSQVIVTLSTETHKSLQAFAQSEGVTQDDAACTLIEEGLVAKGFNE